MLLQRKKQNKGGGIHSLLFYMNIFELQRKARAVDIEVLKEVAIEINSDMIAKLQKEQLNNSKTSKGQPILPKYSNKYAEKKGFDSPDLFLTGEWQSQIEALIETGEVDIVSFDEKSAWLVPRYENLLGLNPDSKDEFRPVVTSTLINLYKDELNLQR